MPRLSIPTALLLAPLAVGPAPADARDQTAPWTPAPAGILAANAAAAPPPLWAPSEPAALVPPTTGDSLPLFGGPAPAPGFVPVDAPPLRTAAGAFPRQSPTLPTSGLEPADSVPPAPLPQPPAGGFPPAPFLAPPAPAGPAYGPPVIERPAYGQPAYGPAFPDEPVFVAPPPAPAPGRVYETSAPAFADAGLADPAIDWSRAVRLDTPTSAALLDFQNRQTDKQLILLGSLPNAFPQGRPPIPVVVPGVQMRLSGLYGRTNTRDKFGYLGRFPPDFNSFTAGDFRILQANLAATAYFTPWAAGYAETQFSDVFSFPSPNQGSFQVRQAYATFGDVTRSPFYAYVGKKWVSFGDMGTLSPFTQAVPWHYFAGLGEGAGVGFVRGGFHAILTGLSGGRGIRVIDSSADGKVNNFAVNAHYAGRVGAVEYLVGAGYLDGTIYNADVPEHINNDLFGPMNGAYDVNGTLRVARWTFAGEFVKTVADWPVTNFPVSAYKAEGAYDLTALGRPLRLSVSWSEGKQAPTGLQFDRNAQLVLGAGWQPNPNALLSLEYVRSIGFAPLIGLTAPGVSERDVRQDSLVLGISLVL